MPEVRHESQIPSLALGRGWDAEGPSDRIFQFQEDGSIAVSLFGLSLLAVSGVKAPEVVWTVRFGVQLKALGFSGRTPDVRTAQYPILTYAREFCLIPMSDCLKTVGWADNPL